MSKNHDYEALLKYMRMLEGGYSISRIHNLFGICEYRLKRLWMLYQQNGVSALHKLDTKHFTGQQKQQVVLEIEKDNLTLMQASLQYGVGAGTIRSWRKKVQKQGIDALLTVKEKELSEMSRPRKKRPEEMTELERLREEVEYLRTENALLKKVKALVEEREARLREIGQKPSKN